MSDDRRKSQTKECNLCHYIADNFKQSNYCIDKKLFYL